MLILFLQYVKEKRERRVVLPLDYYLQTWPSGFLICSGEREGKNTLPSSLRPDGIFLDGRERTRSRLFLLSKSFAPLYPERQSRPNIQGDDMVPTRFLDARTRVRHGLERERQIAEALKNQVNLTIEESTEYEDKERKIDRWLIRGGKRIELQIKYRETGKDLLFEVYDKWFGWDDKRNKVGRDMIGDAKEYAVLLQDRQTVVIVPTQKAKKLCKDMESAARFFGFTFTNEGGSTLEYVANGCRLNLKVQRDPGDGRQKMVAYVPTDYFISEKQAEVYKVRLPQNWK